MIRLLAAASILLLVVSINPPSSPTWPAMGVIIGAPTVPILECPKRDCPEVGKANLGDRVRVTWEEVDGYQPVDVYGVEGYMLPWYVSIDGRTPWLREGSAMCPRIAFVFNIGIGREPSQEVLDTLVREDVDATMFPMGSFARNQPDYLRALNDAGFPIGSHGDLNLSLTHAADDIVTEDTRNSITAIQNVIGRPIDPFHTPYAAETDERVRGIVAREGLLPVGWRVAAADYGHDATEATVYQRVMTGIYPGAIVEFHLDGPATAASTARALPRLITDLRAHGYQFVTVGELMQPCANMPEDLTGTSAIVASSGPEGLACRTAPGEYAPMIAVLSDGDRVHLRGPAFGDWLPVECAGAKGWVHWQYIRVDDQ